MTRPAADKGSLDPALARALERQFSGDDHDLGLIVERLSWTPEQRLRANEAFLRFYEAVRPSGPVQTDEP
jgi:hypothetical protein